jgi:NADPH:quinone reductase
LKDNKITDWRRNNMKAIIATQFGGLDVLTFTEMKIPLLKPSKVLIKVEKTSVNFADIKTRYGKKCGGKLPFWMLRGSS